MRILLSLSVFVLLLSSSSGDHFLRRGKSLSIFDLSLWDYFTFGCHFFFNALDLEPEAYLNTAEIIEYNDFPVEVHHVITDDGYVLEVYRIAGKNRYDTSEPSDLPRTPIILWPEIAFLPESYILSTRNESLGFILADAGFDVWLASWRGLEYSRNHIKIDPDSDEFWKFSLDELGKYDVADTVRYVHNLTGKKVVTMAEGYGGLCVMLGLIARQEINPMINLNVGMSPVATMNRSFSNNVRLMFNMDAASLVEFIRRFDLYRFGMKDPAVVRFYVGLATKLAPKEMIELGVRTMIAAMGKFGTGNFNITRAPVYATHMISEVCIPLYLHVAEGFTTNVVRQYDWGKEENLRRHGTAEPQEYDFKKISSNYLLLRTFNDAVKNKVDSDDLRRRLPASHDFYMVPDKNWHHMSYMMSLGGKAALYDYLIDYIRKLESGQQYRNIEL